MAGPPRLCIFSMAFKYSFYFYPGVRGVGLWRGCFLLPQSYYVPMKVYKVYEMVELEWLGFTYYKCNNNIFFSNLKDVRPSSQFFAWRVDDCEDVQSSISDFLGDKL